MPAFPRHALMAISLAGWIGSASATLAQTENKWVDPPLSGGVPAPVATGSTPPTVPVPEAVEKPRTEPATTRSAPKRPEQRLPATRERLAVD